jgi:hypothetical protein
MATLIMAKLMRRPFWDSSRQLPQYSPDLIFTEVMNIFRIPRQVMGLL